MSTYTDTCNKIKETLVVDYHNRITPQEVNFINPKNKFIGQFELIGHNTIETADISESIMTNSVIKDSVLDNVKFKNGLEIDKAGENLEVISADVIKLTNNINDEISARISSDDNLSICLSDKILHDRHFDLHIVDTTRYPIHLDDFAVNTLIDTVANAYVYDRNDNNKLNPIAKIENIAYDEDGNVKSFVFDAFADTYNMSELTSAGKFKYKFDTIDEVIPTDVSDYKLKCEEGLDLNNMTFVVESLTTSKKLYLITSTENSNKIDIEIPKKDELPEGNYIPSRHFIFNAKVYGESIHDCNFTEVNIVSNNKEDKFYFMNKPVSKFFIQKGKYSTLEFTELRPHRFLINDLDVTDIGFKIKWLYERLSADEISVSADINSLSGAVDELSSEISTTIKRNRDDVSYFGDVQLNDNYGKIQNSLSDLIATNPYTNGKVQYGFMYRCKAPIGSENKKFKIWNDNLSCDEILKDNMYFIISKETPDETIPLDQIKYNDAVFFNDFNIEVNEISNYINDLEISASVISSEVNRLCSEISNDIEAKYSELTSDGNFISAETNRLCTEISNDIEAKYSELTSDDSFISAEVNRLCSEVSTDVEAKYSYLSNEVNSNDCDIKYLSSELSDYHNTLSGIDRMNDPMKDIYSDNLIITSLDNTTGHAPHERYYMTMLSGTLVLKKIK